jgi:hypothetical protein
VIELYGFLKLQADVSRWWMAVGISELLHLERRRHLKLVGILLFVAEPPLTSIDSFWISGRSDSGSGSRG